MDTGLIVGIITGSVVTVIVMSYLRSRKKNVKPFLNKESEGSLRKNGEL